MKPRTLIGVGVVAAVCVGAAWWVLHPARQAQAPVAASDAAAGDTRVLYWYDPMRPEVHFDQPGKSPFMDMQLQPKYADVDAGAGGQGGAAVAVSPAMVQSLGIRTARVERGTFWQRVDTVGSVAINPHTIRVIESRTAGWIEHQSVHEVGTTVHRGQVLAGVYSPELYAAQQELLLVSAQGDPALTAAARKRLSLLGVEDRQIAAVLKTGNAQRRIELQSPSNGVVLSLDAHEGLQIGPAMPLMRIADLAQVWIIAQVPEAQIGWLKLGRPVELRFAALPGERVESTIDYIYPEVDAKTRTLPVRVVVENSSLRLAPGMVADVTLFGGPRRESLMVPSEAVIRTANGNTVIVAQEGHRFRPAAVVIGPEREGRTVILSGLAADEEVVVSGQFLIDSEARLQGVLQRMDAGERPEPSP